MRQNICGEVQTSVLGFGCGSVLGRVGRAASLRAMNIAWDAGITLFDTARSYGYGDAEGVLGEFLRGKRDQAIVATKYGITPRKLSALKRMALPIARRALLMPEVHSLVHRGGHEATFGQFTAAGLRASLELSLRALRTDHVDVLYLHEATAGAMRQPELMAELDALAQAGKMLRAGLYAGAEVAAECMANGPATLSALQFGANVFDPVAPGMAERNQRGMLLIGNHPFSGAQRVTRTKAVLASISADETTPRELRDKRRDCDWQGVLEAIFGMILNGTGMHALVFSMMREDHLRANARAVESSRFTSTEQALMRRRLLCEPAASGA
jgi:aryl-alcohol dehydrogenase-like predicted oxidoreductase